MILTPETIQIITDSAMLAPAIALSDAPAPAAKSGGDHGSGSSVGKAIFAGFIALILLNGNMPVNTQFALIIGLIAYLYFSKKD
jgi:hypothetical protein